MTDLISAREVLNQQLEDPEFRKHWERTALARAFGKWLVRYRVQNELSQRELASRLGMQQSAVARLEAGDHAVRFETVQRTMSRLGETLTIRIGPGGIELETAHRDATVSSTAVS